MISKLAFGSLLFAAAFTSYASATLVFPALLATSGTVAYTMTGAQVGVAMGGIAALAIAKSALLIATIGNRGKREATQLDFSFMFDGIDKSDIGDCGKLLVCQSFAKDEAQRTSEEKAIVDLFDDLSVIQANAYGKYQWAAYLGNFKNPAVCKERYNKCSENVDYFANLIEIH